MDLASPSAESSPHPSFSRASGGGLASLNVLGSPEDWHESGADLPPRAAVPHPAADSDDEEFGGFFIALGFAIPAGLLIWAAVVALVIWQ